MNRLIKLNEQEEEHMEEYILEDYIGTVGESQFNVQLLQLFAEKFLTNEFWKNEFGIDYCDIDDVQIEKFVRNISDYLDYEFYNKYITNEQSYDDKVNFISETNNYINDNCEIFEADNDTPYVLKNTCLFH